MERFWRTNRVLLCRCDAQRWLDDHAGVRGFLDLILACESTQSLLLMRRFFSPDFLTVSATFSNGKSENGTVSPDCMSFSWSDGTSWDAVVAPTPACAAVTRRAPCGQVWDTADSCTNKGCCWDPSGDASIPCFYSSDGSQISFVHVAQSCHFDAGFADGTVQILNRWFTQFFPAAATIGAALEAKGGGLGLKFMAQSWIVSLYVDCPPGAGLDCPDSAALAQFTDSVSKGYIYW
jgi:hypothetical protein